MSRTVLFVAPNSWIVRNWVATGLADLVKDQLGLEPVICSSFEAESFESPIGRKYKNLHVPSGEFGRGDIPRGYSKGLYRLYYLRLRTFAAEVPLGSIQMMNLSRKRDLAGRGAEWLGRLFPRGSRRRLMVRRLVDSYSPVHERSAEILRETRPEMVLVASPGFQFLDQVIMIEADRHRVPVHCVVASWDNMTSRGPMIRRPRTMMVWNDYMKQQAVTIHQYPAHDTYVVGSLQFSRYRDTLSDEEISEMYRRLNLSQGSGYMLFLTGQHVPEYEAEDVERLLVALRSTQYASMPLVVRVHPMADTEPYLRIRDPRLILDLPPRFSAAGDRGEGFDSSEMRAMAALLGHSHTVFASWGTTALLEAAIFDRPVIQLRWMEAFPRRNPSDAARLHDFQKYLHLVPFDATGCRIFSDSPDSIASDLRRLVDERDEFSRRRTEAVERLAVPPFETTPQRIIDAITESVGRSG